MSLPPLSGWLSFTMSLYARRKACSEMSLDYNIFRPLFSPKHEKYITACHGRATPEQLRNPSRWKDVVDTTRQKAKSSVTANIGRCEFRSQRAKCTQRIRRIEIIHFFFKKKKVNTVSIYVWCIYTQLAEIPQLMSVSVSVVWQAIQNVTFGICATHAILDSLWSQDSSVKTSRLPWLRAPAAVSQPASLSKSNSFPRPRSAKCKDQ